MTMDTTTIKLHTDTKHELDQLKEYRNESYNDVIRKMVYIIKNLSTQPELSTEAVIAIEKARRRIREGQFVTEEDAKKWLGF